VRVLNTAGLVESGGLSQLPLSPIDMPPHAVTAQVCRLTPSGKVSAGQSVDEAALVELCRELVAANPRLFADVQAGKLQAAGAFVGQAKKRNPNVNPGRVRGISLDLFAHL
jgi:GatB domain